MITDKEYNELYINVHFQGSYEDYIAADEEVKQLLSDISQLVDDNAEECKVLYRFVSQRNFYTKLNKP